MQKRNWMHCFTEVKGNRPIKSYPRRPRTIKFHSMSKANVYLFLFLGLSFLFSGVLFTFYKIFRSFHSIQFTRTLFINCFRSENWAFCPHLGAAAPIKLYGMLFVMVSVPLADKKANKTSIFGSLKRTEIGEWADRSQCKHSWIPRSRSRSQQIPIKRIESILTKMIVSILCRLEWCAAVCVLHTSTCWAASGWAEPSQRSVVFGDDQSIQSAFVYLVCARSQWSRGNCHLLPSDLISPLSLNRFQRFVTALDERATEPELERNRDQTTK